MFSELKWLLPDGVDEVLPATARRLEHTRRAVLDLLASWGYELVDPPLVEYLESLLSGVGEDLDLQTSKLVDQASGRLIGVRADMTPQVARIDAHRLKRSGPTRLCYVGPVFHAVPDRFLGSRNPLQIGAEIYGHAGPESDLEIAQLLYATLATAGFPEATIDVGHVGVLKAVACAANLSEAGLVALRDILARQALPEMAAFLADHGVADDLHGLLTALPRLGGELPVVAEARALTPADNRTQALHAVLDDLEAFVTALSRRLPQAKVTVDLAETRGYRYHTGLVFTAYIPGEGQEVAWGGRYDHIGDVFGGEPRPATGFSTDLKRLARLCGEESAERGAVLAPADDDPNLEQTIGLLRQEGRVVVRALEAGTPELDRYGCSERLVRVDDGWRIG